jgi:hypothetical protein
MPSSLEAKTTMEKAKKTSFRAKSTASKKATAKGLISSGLRLIGQIIVRGIPLLTIYKEAVRRKNRKRWKRIRRALIWLALAAIAGIIQALASELVHSLMTQMPVEKVWYITIKLSVPMTKPDIEIRYRHTPKQLINAFTENVDKSISVKVHQDDLEYFDGPEDIVIYVKEHITELIAGGILVNAAWDVIKYAIISIWRLLVAFCSKRKAIDKNIDLVFEMKSGSSIEFRLSGNVDPSTIGDLIKWIENYLRDKERQKKDFINPDFIDKRESKPRIRVRYNSETKTFELLNYKNLEKQRQELIKRLMNGLDA